jgi:hypothetical protein
MDNILLGIVALATKDAALGFATYICGLDVIQPMLLKNYFSRIENETILRHLNKITVALRKSLRIQNGDAKIGIFFN